MGAVTSRIAHKLQNFNLEARAQKVLLKEKPTRAPQFHATLKQIEQVKQIDPDAMEQLRKKDTSLDNRLKSVYISSHDPEIKEHTDRPTSTRSLPKNIHTEQYEFDFSTPIHVPEGKCTLQQLISYIDHHATDPNKYTAIRIASESKLEPKTVEIILSYYKLLRLVGQPQVTKEEFSKFAVESETRKPLPDK
ncbi:protein NDUFAF4 homolog isoform X2 [Cephus cinctus]|nr:protein NDUFAF4 homolog isoform X2 [Cephus cinctus]XP_015590233.1 protein NDUFAF4 homolog isoform X2 [Cephus cinctus]XP_015590234.1 protein NDUFAF4 homolog isoform X2 [Cephus cinctus]XP_015590235.1 protein NDUFAF4 homolog isoform X2 [Cephus cinctus]XP_024938436.1 protein NDUFAF4 homolog isoform X2 [Cephus cinctus]XP_024938437.1 protein NDUFAF4 homolog isoform X2 [Cephus cinctus]XP_024938438.1 protein NDUFAF4 homolog isoform X2 [Cephus cinctus]XP_024938439.1 protein NDUFAF4 homolog isoform